MSIVRVESPARVGSEVSMVRVGSVFTGAALLAASLTSAAATSLAVATAAAPPSSATPSNCQLGPNGQIQHVIYLEFDNTHFMRDIGRDGSTNVPSDLEQMPHLLNFMESNGTLLSNHHTQLISHTSDDITTSITGVYPDRHGVATAANSYQVYNANGTTSFQSGFTYWTSKARDGQYNFTSAPNTNAPAPWVPFTRAGCNVGAAAMTGFVPENTTTDLATIFGPGSPPTTDPHAFADYVGVAVHCAAGNALCSSANGGAGDVLPDEPKADGSLPATPGAGYQGYSALYGHKSLTQALRNMGAPTGVLDAGGNLNDINGNTIVDDFAGTLTPGFPGFSMAPQYSLGYVADMQESGIPVTFAYIITPHRPLPQNPYGYGFPSDTRDYGPGEADYVAALHQYDDAFATFFARLQNDGINKSNTLFVVTSEEGDHFVGGAPSPAGCEGVTVPCTYSQTGEVTTDYKGLMQGEQGSNLPVPPASTVSVTNDDAPDLYLVNNPSPHDPVTRAYERATGALTVTSPISQTVDQLTQDMANPVEFNILHMLTADPLRTPTFTAFANPDYYVEGQAVTGCAGSATPSSACVMETPGFAWNHGDVQPQITTTWAGFVGPGIAAQGLDGPDPTAEAHGVRFGTFSDHTDIRPTMLQLLALQDDYASDGRVLVEDMADSGLPPALQSGSLWRAQYVQLAQLYKQLNAPVGAFGLATLQFSTTALESSSPDDSAYNNLEQRLVALGISRDAIATALLQALNSPFGQQAPALAPGVAARLSGRAQGLLERVSDMTGQQ
jgi:hypothetical protein